MLKTMKGQKMGNLFVSVAQNPVVLSATNLQSLFPTSLKQL